MRQPVSHYRSNATTADDDFGWSARSAPRNRRARDRRLPAILLTLAVMALFAGGLWFAYVQGTAARARRRGAARRRAADPRRRAADQGQARTAGRHGGPRPEHLALQRQAGGAPVENLLPPPEQPMPRPAPRRRSRQPRRRRSLHVRRPRRRAAARPASRRCAGAAAASRRPSPPPARNRRAAKRRPHRRQRRRRQAASGASDPARFGAQRGGGARRVGPAQAGQCRICSAI